MKSRMLFSGRLAFACANGYPQEQKHLTGFMHIPYRQRRKNTLIITNEMLDSFRRDFDQAMQPLMEKYDVTISLGRITYGEETFRAALQVTASRDKEEIARAQFDEEAWKFSDIGIEQGMYKRIFIGTDGKEYAITGLKPRYKQPLIAKQIDNGRTYRCGRHFISEWTDTFYAEVLDS